MNRNLFLFLLLFLFTVTASVIEFANDGQEIKRINQLVSKEIEVGKGTQPINQESAIDDECRLFLHFALIK